MAEECLIDETFNVFSDKDNESFLSFPNEEEVKKKFWTKQIYVQHLVLTEFIHCFIISAGTLLEFI